MNTGCYHVRFDSALTGGEASAIVDLLEWQGVDALLFDTPAQNTK